MKHFLLLIACLFLAGTVQAQNPYESIGHYDRMQRIMNAQTVGKNITYPSEIDSLKILYQSAFSEIISMLDGTQPASFKRAVFEVENAYLDGMLDWEAFQQELDLLTGLAWQVMQTRKLNYDGRDKSTVETHAALFTVMTDTLAVLLNNEVSVKHLPFRYDFEDVFGRSDWSQMFVTKLLTTRTGNCHSLPYLYKILSEDMNVPAHLALAPNHVYIKLRNEQSGWYSTELTSGQFPIDAWILASGYVHIDAIRNGIYMEALTTRQSLALMLVDLAIGYERKTAGMDPDFVIDIIEKALEYDPNSINALLLKAKTFSKKLQRDMMKLGFKTLEEIKRDIPVKEKVRKVERLYSKIHNLGYRQMPEEMYIVWLHSLEKETEKYQNTNLPFLNN